MDTKENFSFIANHIELTCGLPFELAPGYTIKKPDDVQIAAIEKHLERLGQFICPSPPELPYRVSYSFKKLSDQEVHITTRPIEKSKWKYFITSYEEDGSLDLFKIQLAANIADVVLTFDLLKFEVFTGEYACTCEPDLVFRFFSEIDHTVQHKVNLEDLQQIKQSYKNIPQIQNAYPGIMRSMTLYNSLRYLPKYHDLKTLGLLTVIESLLTHDPQSSETGDSLTRQVRTKVPLIFRRCRRDINYSGYFGKVKEDKVWKTLYGYRSCLAHGEDPDFNGKFRMLKNPGVVNDFLTQSTKLLLLQALAEPQLITDLKEC
jgi:hypothetical protein